MWDDSTLQDFNYMNVYYNRASDVGVPQATGARRFRMALGQGPKSKGGCAVKPGGELSLLLVGD